MAVPIAIPVGATAQRPTWEQLPPVVRAEISSALGAPVVAARSQNSGFTPGFASRLELADGRQYFVKAADRSIAWLAQAYATETEVLALLPPSVAAPRVRQRFHLEDGTRSWLVVVFDDIEGRSPRRPWQRPEAAAVLATAAQTAQQLTPAPPGRHWGLFTDDVEVPSTAVTTLAPELIGRVRELVAAAPTLLAGSTLVHGDLRDDNVIVGADDRIWFCDWNWPSLGPLWADAACLSISMVGDGLDAEALFDGCPVLAGVDPDAIDSLLAVLVTYFCSSGAQAPAEGSPHIRPHQRWYAEVLQGWLHRRWSLG